MSPFLLSILLPLAIATDPTVHLSTGIYNGIQLPGFNQDAFLGIPYAAKPERFTPSSVLITNSTEAHDAKSYGTSCPAYGSDTDKFVREGLIRMGEDCLSLNVVRPAGVEEGAQLPVAVWIYGGTSS
jgi:carboxylesterase type B